MPNVDFSILEKTKKLNSVDQNCKKCEFLLSTSAIYLFSKNTPNHPIKQVAANKALAERTKVLSLAERNVSVSCSA
jgi:hypothetical protein